MMSDSFFIRISGKFKGIPCEEVIYILARKNYSEVFTTKGQYFIYVPICRVEAKLPRNLFCRINRSCIVSTQKVKEFDREFVYLENCKLHLGQQYYEHLMNKVILICPEYDSKFKKEIEGLDVEGYIKKAKGENQNK